MQKVSLWPGTICEKAARMISGEAKITYSLFLLEISGWGRRIHGVHTESELSINPKYSLPGTTHNRKVFTASASGNEKANESSQKHPEHHSLKSPTNKANSSLTPLLHIVTLNRMRRIPTQVYAMW